MALILRGIPACFNVVPHLFRDRSQHISESHSHLSPILGKHTGRGFAHTLFAIYLVFLLFVGENIVQCLGCSLSVYLHLSSNEILDLLRQPYEDIVQRYTLLICTFSSTYSLFFICAGRWTRSLSNVLLC